MSENWGADGIPRPRGVTGNLVEALSAAQHLPVEALDAAARQPGRIAEAVIAAVETAADGGPLDERGRNLLFWGVHALAQGRETRLAGPLLRLLRRPGGEFDELFEDALGTTLPRVVASVFDGDPGTLEEALADPSVDEAVRHGLFGALAVLTADGRVAPERTGAFLVRFDEERLARSGEATWAGWEAAIALCGFSDLVPRVLAARAEGRLLDDLNGPGWFDAALAEAVARPGDRARFDASGLGYVDDAAAELDEMLAEAGDEPEPAEPVRNPLRDVGRNDPCPCGSGKKHKKCCLGEAA